MASRSGVIAGEEDVLADSYRGLGIHNLDASKTRENSEFDLMVPAMAGWAMIIAPKGLVAKNVWTSDKNVRGAHVITLKEEDFLMSPGHHSNALSYVRKDKRAHAGKVMIVEERAVALAAQLLQSYRKSNHPSTIGVGVAAIEVVLQKGENAFPSKALSTDVLTRATLETVAKTINAYFQQEMPGWAGPQLKPKKLSQPRQTRINTWEVNQASWNARVARAWSAGAGASSSGRSSSAAAPHGVTPSIQLPQRSKTDAIDLDEAEDLLMMDRAAIIDKMQPDEVRFIMRRIDEVRTIGQGIGKNVHFSQLLTSCEFECQCASCLSKRAELRTIVFKPVWEVYRLNNVDVLPFIDHWCNGIKNGGKLKLLRYDGEENTQFFNFVRFATISSRNEFTADESGGLKRKRDDPTLAAGLRKNHEDERARLNARVDAAASGSADVQERAKKAMKGLNFGFGGGKGAKGGSGGGSSGGSSARSSGGKKGGQK